MAWEDGLAQSVHSQIDAAESAISIDRKKRILLQALSSAKCIPNEYQRKNLVKLIEDKLKDI